LAKAIERLKLICEELQANDRNGDVMQCFEEFENGDLHLESLYSIIKREISIHLEDFSDIQNYYKWLGIWRSAFSAREELYRGNLL
jgi:hypothetical protein